MAKIMPRALNSEEVLEILSLTQEDITLDKMKYLFASTASSKAKFNTNDTFILPANKLYNSERINTTVGRYVYNLFILFPNIIKHIGYVNKPLSGKAIEGIESEMALLLRDDKIKYEDFRDYLDKTQWIGFACANFLTTSIEYDIVITRPSVAKRKKELEKIYEKEIKAGDTSAIVKMEKELLDIAEKEVKDLDSYEIFSSGVSKGFGNNYKNISVMRGAIVDNNKPGSYNISTANLVEGIPKEEYAAYADLTVQASYSRAIGTQNGGYLGKQLDAAFQTIQADKKGTDCGTRKTLKVYITSKNKKDYLDRYIMDRGNKILLDTETINKYVDKYVDMRSPMYCKSEKMCNICTGELYYKLGIKNVGLLTHVISSRLLTHSLKKFHNTTISLYKLDINKYISE